MKIDELLDVGDIVHTSTFNNDTVSFIEFWPISSSHCGCVCVCVYAWARKTCARVSWLLSLYLLLCKWFYWIVCCLYIYWIKCTLIERKIETNNECCHDISIENLVGFTNREWSIDRIEYLKNCAWPFDWLNLSKLLYWLNLSTACASIQTLYTDQILTVHLLNNKRKKKNMIDSIWWRNNLLIISSRLLVIDWIISLLCKSILYSKHQSNWM